ncbi:uncharacterized protein LOC120086031 isoform X3 [Benincasa hispida]|uniref:uncharacterized protein LOC120086031 isoform X3 n=1 Tax=Benincasa hispida TaxID=102211 RepID=UPI001900948D|nr:uncharacterized protein LOC120086031 isoform X3 [Benincasa hispida]XP_038898365.1 uncharacterized protein LOC120086031 isoform X3 [Benincasa hispida]
MTSVSLHLNIFWTTLMWVVAIVSLPGRILAALQRERQLRQYLQFLEIEFNNVLWERKELQKQFQAAMREHKMMELMLDELEMIHEKATNKISLLESEMQKLRNENLRLQEIKGKAYWSLKGLDVKSEAQKTGRVDSDITHGISSCSSSYGSSSIIQDLFQSDALKDGSISKEKLIKILDSGLKSGVFIHSHTEILSKDEDVTEILDEQREVAISRSLFSTLLSLLVGVIIWEAEEPHLCLVVALMFVVSISLKSVVEFFTTIKNKPALDAVSLLSFNWFVLGILAYPTLPIIARLLAPPTLRIVEWFSFSIS